jgi:hypothetical protein
MGAKVESEEQTAYLGSWDMGAVSKGAPWWGLLAPFLLALIEDQFPNKKLSSPSDHMPWTVS